MSCLNVRLCIAAAIGFFGCAGSASAEDLGAQKTVYLRTDLVANLQALVQPPDPNLQNDWGVANAPAGRFGFPTTTTVFRRSMMEMA